MNDPYYIQLEKLRVERAASSAGKLLAELGLDPEKNVVAYRVAEHAVKRIEALELELEALKKVTP